MTLALSHSNVAQSSRYWSLGEKYTGHNGHFLTYLNELIKEVEYQMNNKKEYSRAHEIRKRAYTYLCLIQKNKLSAGEAIRDNHDMCVVRTMIKDIPLMKDDSENYTITVNGEQLVVSSSFNFGTNLAGDLTTECENEVSHYLKLVIDAGCADQAAEVIQSMGPYNNRTGFATIERLADVFGRDAGHLTLLPTNFEWGTRNLFLDWSAYKLMIQTHDYINLHPGCETLVVQSAKVGFEKYIDAIRVLDHVRVQLGQNPSWSDFIISVDKFLGDTYRADFEKAVINKEIPTRALNTFSITDDPENIQVEQINKVGQGKFLPKDKTPDDNKGKVESKKSKNDFGKPLFAQPKKEEQKGQNKKGCAWCQSKDHYTNLCTNYGGGRWSKKKCNRCSGFGHPQDVCPNPPKNKKF